MTSSLCVHHTAEELFALSRRAVQVRSVPWLRAMRDVVLGESRQAVRARYGISHDTV